jgi:hypothetical protein
MRDLWYRHEMSGRHALSSDAALPRLLVQAAGSDDGFDVFDVVAASGDVLQVRSAFLFEVGEQLRVRLLRDGAVATAIARIRAHIGPDDARITVLELSAPDPQPGCSASERSAREEKR